MDVTAVLAGYTSDASADDLMALVDSIDENNGLGSPTGLEDDALVLNAVCVYLGRNDLHVAIG